MKYFISSNLNYFKKTYPLIIKSLLESNIRTQDIYMVVGHCKDFFEFDNPLNINISYVEYNSFDFNALIYASENLEKIDTDYIFLLHDTCLVGKNFKILSNNYEEGCSIKKLHKSISMNIGLYSSKVLNSNKETIKNFKMYPRNEKEIQDCKRICVLKEDFLFNQYKIEKNYYSIYEDSKFFNKEELILQFPNYYHQYLNQIKRRVQYIPDLDLYKFQANIGWQSRWIVEI